MKHRIAVFYVIGMHIVIAIVLIKPSCINKVYYKLGIKSIPEKQLSGHEYYMEKQWNYFANRSKTLDASSRQMVFLGNSMTNSFCVESNFNAINLGVSGETVYRAKDKVILLENLQHKRIVLAYGINDIPRETYEIFEDYKILIRNLPKSATIYISSILPIDESLYFKRWKIKKTNAQINRVNTLLKAYAKTQQQVYFLDASRYLYNSSGQLSKELQIGDGIHLNTKGNLLWAKGIKEAIHKIE